jgi:hypothetical protein
MLPLLLLLLLVWAMAPAGTQGGAITTSIWHTQAAVTTTGGDTRVSASTNVSRLAGWSALGRLCARTHGAGQAPH